MKNPESRKPLHMRKLSWTSKLTTPFTLDRKDSFKKSDLKVVSKPLEITTKNSEQSKKGEPYTASFDHGSYNGPYKLDPTALKPRLGAVISPKKYHDSTLDKRAAHAHKLSNEMRSKMETTVEQDDDGAKKDGEEMRRRQLKKERIRKKRETEQTKRDTILQDMPGRNFPQVVFSPEHKLTNERLPPLNIEKLQSPSEIFKIMEASNCFWNPKDGARNIKPNVEWEKLFKHKGFRPGSSRGFPTRGELDIMKSRFWVQGNPMCYVARYSKYLGLENEAEGDLENNGNTRRGSLFSHSDMVDNWASHYELARYLSSHSPTGWSWIGQYSRYRVPITPTPSLLRPPPLEKCCPLKKQETEHV